MGIILNRKQREWATTHRVLFIGFVLALLIVLGLSLFAWGVFHLQSEVEQSMSQTTFHLEQLDRMNKLLQESAISERGYILTGNEHHYDEYRRAKSQLQYHLNYLLIRTNTLQGKNYSLQLDSLIEKSFRIMDQRLQIRKESGAEAAIQAIKGRGIEDDIAQVENVLLQFKQFERGGLDSEISAMRLNFNRSLIIYGVGLVVSVVLLVMVYYQLNRQIRIRRAMEKELRQSQERLQEAQRIAHLGHWEWDIPFDRITWSKEVYNIFGIPGDVSQKNYQEFLNAVHPEERARVDRAVKSALKSGSIRSLDHRILLADGTERYVQQQAEVKFDEAGQPIQMLGTVQDISQRKRDEEAIRAREELLRSVVESAPIIIFVLDKDGIFTFSEGRGLGKIGLQSGEVTGKSIFKVYRDFPDIISNFKRALNGEDFVEDTEVDGIIFETHYLPLYTQDGQLTNVLGVSTDITDRRRSEERLKQAYDELEDRVHERTEELADSNNILIKEIEERNRVESQLKKSLHEKEILLKEIHHRVKNNLQVISSLLFLQSKKFDDEKVMAAMQESQNRVRTMALIHEKLYQSGDFTAIDFGNYLNEIIRFLKSTYSVESKHITFQVEADHLELGLDYAIPCGLVVNELVSNSLKHAFNGRQNGEISIRMHAKDSDSIELTVRDNGIGLPADTDVDTTKSLGMQLVKNLVSQIDGTLKREQNNGTIFSIIFKQKLNGKS